MRASTLAAAFIACAAVPRVSLAAPTLRVRAQTAIDAHATRSHGALVISGQLRDDLAVPIAHASVTLKLAYAPSKQPVALQSELGAPSSCGAEAVTTTTDEVQTRTDEAGRLCVRVPLPVDRYAATLSSAPSDYYEAASAEVPADLTRAAVVLEFDPEPRIVSLDAPPAELDAIATTEDDDARTPAPGIALSLENESGTTVGRATTDAAGRARFTVEPTALGAPGRGELVLKFEGNALLGNSVHHALIERDARVTLAPTSLVRGGVPEDGIVLPIAATTKLGPVTSGSVEARVGESVVGAAPLSAQGTASLVASFTPGTQKDVPVRIRYAADAPWFKPGDELLVNVPVEAPSPLRQVPLVVIGAALAAWLIAGRVVKKRSTRPKTSTSPTAPEGVAGISIIGAPRSRRGVLVGTVVDAHDGSPVERARVAIEETRIQDVRVVASAFTDAHGRFRLDESGANSAMHLVSEGPLHAALRQPLPQAAEVQIALVLRKRRILERLVQWARAKGAPFDARPEPTPGHVRKVAERDRRDVEEWALAIERAAYDEGEVDARVEQEIDALSPDAKPRAK